MPDRRTMDQTMASLEEILQGQEFESFEEVNAFLQNLIKDGAPLPPPPAETPLEKAQAVMYQAFKAQGRRRIKLAREALAISPDCADAYVLLAQEEAKNLQEANAYYAQGVQAGRRALGPEVFRKQVGHFWGMMQTRPFMRALEGYAMTLWALGDLEASVAHQQEMLRLNPGDNQGIRYFLIHCLLDLERLADAERLFKKYGEESTANFSYPGALAAFLKEGASAKANRRLKAAFTANPHVPAYLLAEKRLPRYLPDSYSMGSVDEAILYAADFGDFWHQFDGPLEWLREMREQVPIPKPESQDDFLDLEWDDEAVWDFDEEFDEEFVDFPPFRLDDFLAAGEFPKAEHGSIRRCLAIGLGKYYFAVYGYEKYGKQPTYLIDERMHVPYLFGYGALEVIRHKRLRPASKLFVCQHALNILRIDVEDGVPYGMLTLLGYMASQGVLEYGMVLAATSGLGFGRTFDFGFSRMDWFEGSEQAEMLALVDWLAANENIPADEKLWWAWRLGIQSEKRPPVGKAVANRWLSLDALSTDAKLKLCHAWLVRKGAAGTPPLIWQLNQATTTGEFGEVKRLIEEHDIKVEPEIRKMLDEATREYVAPEPGSIEEIELSIREWVMVPAFLHRLAIPALVRFGEDLEQTIETYWEANGDYYGPANTAGVADAIREFGERLSPERLRELIERGINHKSALTRKTFYMLSEEYYGDEYLMQALEDNAGSLRTWAAKKLAKGR